MQTFRADRMIRSFLTCNSHHMFFSLVRTKSILCAPEGLVRTAKIFQRPRAHQTAFHSRDRSRAHGATGTELGATGTELGAVGTEQRSDRELSNGAVA